MSIKEQITKTIKKSYPLHFLTFLLAIPFSIQELIKPNVNVWIASFLNLILVQSWIPKTSVYFSNNAVSWYLSVYLFLMLLSPFVVRYLKQLNTKQIICLLLTYCCKFHLCFFRVTMIGAIGLFIFSQLLEVLISFRGGYSIVFKAF